MPHFNIQLDDEEIVLDLSIFNDPLDDLSGYIASGSSMATLNYEDEDSDCIVIESDEIEDTYMTFNCSELICMYNSESKCKQIIQK